MTRLTLVTSVRNGMPFLPEALASIGESPDGAVEHLVIDAGSTDGSLPFLRSRRDLRLLERPGLSLYGAWNLALDEAQGEFIGFLNADDWLGPGRAKEILSGLSGANDAEILCGRAEAFVGISADPPRYRYYKSETTGPSIAAFLFGAPIINAKFFRRDLLGRFRFDESFRIAADRQLLLRLLFSRDSIRWRQHPAVLYRYRIHAGSQTLAASRSNRLLMAQEHQRLAAEHLADAADAPTRNALRRWAAREGVVAAFCHAGAGEPRRALGSLAALAISDPFFALRLPAAHAAIAALRRASAGDGGA